MPTVIDSFVVELGLDPSKFTKGQREALDEAKKLENQQLASAKNIEHSSTRAADAISGIRTQALSMLAVLTGGKGLLDFSTNLATADQRVGRLERNLGISAQTIGKWQGLARIMGGDAATMAASFTAISDAFAGWKIGMVTPLIADLRAISTAGGKIIDVNQGVEQSYLDLAENLRNINAKDPATAGLLGRKIGLDPALYDAMISGNMQKILDYVQKIGVATKQDIDAFDQLMMRINSMGLKAESLGRKVLGGENGAASKITALADELNKPWQEARPWDALFGWGEYAPGKGGGKLFSDPIAPTGAFKSQAEKEQFIRAEAAKRRINPNTAMHVAKSEGFNSFVSTIPGETSYGAFQLHVTPGGRGNHVGDRFKKDTGLDPADRANEKAGILYALDDIQKNGWGAYHGAKNTGIGRWDGIDRSGGNTSTSTTQVNINGPITVQPPQGSEPADFAQRFAAALKEQSFTAQADAGQD